MSDKSENLQAFAGFTVDLEKKILWRGGDPVALPPKAVEILVALVKKRGAVVSKNELIETVWGAAFVEESNLTNNIYLLRKALTEATGEKNLIQTVPRRGYRFGGELERANAEFVLEHHVFEQVLIREVPAAEPPAPKIVPPQLPAALGSPVFSRNSVYLLAGVLLVAATAFAAIWWFRAAPPRPKTLAEVRSIAVLPLKSFSGDSADDALRLRITDALAARLGNLPNVSVRPTSSVLQFSGATAADALDIGRKLNVDAVLDGSLQTENDRVRVLLRFISVADGAQIWADQFDGKANEILVLQDRIAARLLRRENFPALAAGALETSAAAARPTESNEAFELFLKGRFFWNQRTEESLKRSIEFFEQAIEKDSNFALAHTGLAKSYCVLPEYSSFPETQAYAAAERSAMRALELDEKSAEARAALAFVEFWRRSDAANAERNFRRAVELNPNYATARHWFANVLLSQKRLPEAEIEMRAALRLDPLSSVINTELGDLLYYRREFAAAETQLRAALELEPQSARARNWLGRVLTAQGKTDAAIIEFQKALDDQTAKIKRDSVISEMIFALARADRRPEAEKRLAELVAAKDKSAINLAIAYAGLNDTPNTLKWLRETERERRSDLAFVSLDPVFDNLRNEPEFQTLVSRND